MRSGATTATRCQQPASWQRPARAGTPAPSGTWSSPPQAAAGPPPGTRCSSRPNPLPDRVQTMAVADISNATVIRSDGDQTISRVPLQSLRQVGETRLPGVDADQSQQRLGDVRPVG